MSLTGTYKWDKELNEWVKTSDHVKLTSHGLNGPVYCPEGGYFDKSLRRFFPDAKTKANFMRENKIIHEGSNEDDSRRTERLCGVINDDRNKKGMKSKTVQELVGNSRNVETHVPTKRKELRRKK